MIEITIKFLDTACIQLTDQGPQVTANAAAYDPQQVIGQRTPVLSGSFLMFDDWSEAVERLIYTFPNAIRDTAVINGLSSVLAAWIERNYCDVWGIPYPLTESSAKLQLH